MTDEFVSEVNRDIDKMQQFNREARQHLSRFPAGERRFHDITAKMEEYLAGQRRLAGTPNATVVRSQLSVAMNQVSTAAEQLHNDVKSLGISFRSNATPVFGQVTGLKQACRESGQPGTGHDVPPTVRAACVRLMEADPEYEQRFGAVARGLSRLQEVYETERTTQEKLLAESQRLQ
jgi:hypothetical protein